MDLESQFDIRNVIFVIQLRNTEMEFVLRQSLNSISHRFNNRFLKQDNAYTCTLIICNQVLNRKKSRITLMYLRDNLKRERLFMKNLT